MSGGVRVALTGGSGFVGRAVCAELLTRGCDVVALSRTSGCAPAGVDTVIGSLQDRAAVDALVAGASVIINAAGLVRTRDEMALNRVNVDGVLSLLDASAAADRFVQVSTAGVHGRPGGSVSEDSRFAPRGPYEVSKAAAETEIRRRRSDGVTFVRPTDILGVGHPLDPLARFIRAVERGRVWTWGGAWSNYVGVEAVAEAVAAVALDPAPPCALLVNAPERVVALAELVASLTGVPNRVHLLPSIVARPARRLVALAGSDLAVLHRVGSALDTTRFESSNEDWLASRGVVPGLEMTLRMMIADYRARGLL